MKLAKKGLVLCRKGLKEFKGEGGVTRGVTKSSLVFKEIKVIS
jgi:hypothetical protein